MLAHSYRITAVNSTGQTLANAAIVVKLRRWKYGTDGAISFEGAPVTVWTSSGTIVNGASSSSATVDNSTNKYLGGQVEISVTAPASSNGNVTFYMDVSVDGGSTWPDPGLGQHMTSINFTTSGTKVTTLSV